MVETVTENSESRETKQNTIQPFRVQYFMIHANRTSYLVVKNCTVPFSHDILARTTPTNFRLLRLKPNNLTLMKIPGVFT
jgi:hypothetical protein